MAPKRKNKKSKKPESDDEAYLGICWICRDTHNDFSRKQVFNVPETHHGELVGEVPACFDCFRTELPSRSLLGAPLVFCTLFARTYTTGRLGSLRT